MRHLGIGAKLARRRNVTATSLARRIRQVLASPRMTARAETVAAAMRGENGVRAAVDLIMARFQGATLAGHDRAHPVQT